MNWFGALWKKFKDEAAERHAREEFYDRFQNFTPRAQWVVQLAKQNAVRLKHPFVDTEHLLLGLMDVRQGCAFNVLNQRLGVKAEVVSREVERIIGRGEDSGTASSNPSMSKLERVLCIADEERKTLKHTYVGTEHLLLALLRERDGGAARVLTHFKMELKTTREEVLRELDPNFENE